MGGFHGKTVVVTGAGRGLGRVTARLFLKAGAHVAYLTRTPTAELRNEVRNAKRRALCVAVDVAEPSQVHRAFDRVHRRFRTVDILVNNAGIADGGRLDEMTPDVWDRVMANNVRSQFLCVQAAAPYMKAQRRGKIINVSSVAGRDKSMILGCAYTTSKAAIIGFTRHAAAELAPFGINVNCICPSQHRTPMLDAVLTPDLEAALLKKIPLGYIAQPEQIASVILFLASDAASYMSGSVVDINGGML